MTVFCPVCQDKMHTGDRVCEAELPILGLVRFVPVHERCGLALQQDQATLIATIERVARDVELARQAVGASVRRRLSLN